MLTDLLRCRCGSNVGTSCNQARGGREGGSTPPGLSRLGAVWMTGSLGRRVEANPPPWAPYPDSWQRGASRDLRAGLVGTEVDSVLLRPSSLPGGGQGSREGEVWLQAWAAHCVTAGLPGL